MPIVEPFPEDSDRKQGIARATEMGISFIPGVGSALQVAFNELAARRLNERRSRWLNDLALHVHTLEDRIGDFATLTSDDAFMDALTTATQIAVRTSQADKLALLRNTVVNSVLPDAPDLDTQQLFFDMIDRFTPTHVRLLHLLSDPPAWFQRHDIVLRNITMGPKTAIIEAGLPELAGRGDLISRYGGALNSAGLISQALSGVMSNNGLWAAATSPLGEEFLAFVTDPTSTVT